MMQQVQGGWNRDLREIQEEMERFLGHLSQSKRRPVILSGGGWRPSMDVYETAGNVVVLIEAAGVRAADVEVVVDGRTLLVRGRRYSRSSTPRQVYHQLEIAFGSFARAIELPTPVDADSAVASYQDGFLEIVLPKAEEAATRSITIKAVVPKP